MTLTDEIRKELREGLRKGVKYEQIRVKFDKDKGPFYNALGTVFTDIGAEIESLASERNRIAEEVAKAKAKLDGLTEDAERIETEDEAAQRRLSELNQTEQNLNNKIGKLEKELAAKGELLNKARALEGAGFTTKRLEILQEKVATICAKRGIEPKKAVDAFFKDLDAYDAKHGWGLEFERLKTLARTEASKVGRWKEEARKLELRYAGRKEIVDGLEGLMTRGVRGDDILAWGRILDAAGKTVRQFELDIGSYGDVELILKAKLKQIDDMDRKIGVLKSQVAALEKRKSEIESSIQVLADSGVREIEKVGNEAMGELTRLIEQAKRFGEIKAEAGRLEEELKAARHLRVNNPVVVAFFPKEVIVSLLNKVKLWSTLNDVNPKVKLPEWMKEKYLFTYYSGTAFELVDLLELVLAGLLEAEVQKK
jgi:chorismate mutase